jgi:hypothetical protein
VEESKLIPEIDEMPEILRSLDAFYLEHRRCGELLSGVERKDAKTHVVWMTCSCGGRFARDVVDQKLDSSSQEDCRDS